MSGKIEYKYNENELIKQFKEYVDKYIKVYVGYMGIKSKEYYDYSPGEIAKMIYEDYPKPPGRYLYFL